MDGKVRAGSLHRFNPPDATAFNAFHVLRVALRPESSLIIGSGAGKIIGAEGPEKAVKRSPRS